jgi:hypothetical protein
MSKVKFIIIFIILFSSCKENSKNFQKLEVWEKIQEAVQKRNIDYLLNISSDSLQCLECSKGKHWVTKEVFFRDNFDQMKLGENENYGYFIENIEDLNIGFKERIRISYGKKYKGNKYDIIYTILRNESNIKFSGVFSIP